MEKYGDGILKMKEIIGMRPITTISRAPRFLKGVINLRGKVILVVDLKFKFGMKETACTERTCVLVVEIKDLRSVGVGRYCGRFSGRSLKHKRERHRG